jgi:hypothetical protein
MQTACSVITGLTTQHLEIKITINIKMKTGNKSQNLRRLTFLLHNYKGNATAAVNQDTDHRNADSRTHQNQNGQSTIFHSH